MVAAADAAAAAAAAAAAGTAVAHRAAAHSVHYHTPDTAAVLELRSMPPTVWPAPVAAIADAARTLATPSSTHFAHLQTCLQTAPGTSEYPAAVQQLAGLQEAHVCDAPDQRNAAGCRAKAGVVTLSDHQWLAELRRWCHAVGRSADGDITTHKETAVEAARCREVVEAEAGGIARLVDGLHSVGAEAVEHS